MNVTSSIVPLFHAGGWVLVEFDNGEMKVKGVEKNLPKGEESFNIVVLDVKLLREWFLASVRKGHFDGKGMKWFLMKGEG